MLPTYSPVCFKVPLTRLAHSQAQEFYFQHSQFDKTKQVYLNILAIYAVNYYLKCFDFSTNFDCQIVAIKQVLSSSATLEVNETSKLECCPVLPNEKACYIPADVWTDRIGYIAVQLNQELTEAILLGFINQVETEEVPLEQFYPIETLLDYLSLEQPVIYLNQWFNHIFLNGWQRFEDIAIKIQQELELSEKKIASSFRNRNQLDNVLEVAKVLNLSRIDTETKQAKLKDIGLNLGSQSAILLVAITSEKNGKIGINIQLHPSPQERYLPSNIKLELLSATDELLKLVSARTSDNWIQLPYLKCSSGESFKARVTLEDISLVETFSV